MSRMQKFAWFNLAVIALTLVAVLSLLPSDPGSRGHSYPAGSTPLAKQNRSGRPSQTLHLELAVREIH